LQKTQTMFWQSSNFLSVGLFQWRGKAPNGKMVSMRLSYSYLRFHIVSPNKAQHLLGTTLTVPLNENISAIAGVTMDAEVGVPLFKGGLSISF